jgi:hypothetical protein
MEHRIVSGSGGVTTLTITGGGGGVAAAPGACRCQSCLNGGQIL